MIEMNAPLRHRGYTFYQASFAEQNGKEFTVLANTEYRWRLRLATAELTSGSKTYAWGTSADDDTNVSETTQNVPQSPGTFSSGTFTTGGSQTSCFLTLKVANSGKYAVWDDILLETVDG